MTEGTMEQDEKTAIGNISAIDNNGSPALKSSQSPWVADFYFTDIYDEKACKAFVKAVEKMIRQSREYKAYIDLLRTNVQELNHDNIQSNITTGDVDLEFHHYPFTMYDIVESVMSHHVMNEERFTSFGLAKEVMSLHYRNIIGIVPLTQTNHELAHSGNLFISKEQIFGDYREFMKEYDDGISVDLKDKVQSMENLSEKEIPSDFNRLMG